MDIKEKKEKLLEMKKKYLALKHNIPEDVRSTIHGKEIIQGERSLQMQLPQDLQRKTIDYDIYSSNPEISAEQTERRLDEEFGGDYFYVKKAKHEGTYKVKSRIDDETYADFTKPSEPTPNIKIGETRYTTLKFELMKAIRTLKNKQFAHRHHKDLNRVKRIKEYNKRKQIINKWF